MNSEELASRKRWLGVLKTALEPLMLDADKLTAEEIAKRKHQHDLYVMNALAGEILHNLEGIKPQAFYDRPAGVPSDDVDVWTTMEVVRKRGGRAGQEDRQVARDASEWLQELYTAEAKSAATLGVLCRAVETLEEIAGSVSIADIERIRQHVLHHWGCDVLEAPHGDKRKQNSWCMAQCRQDDIAPTWLMNRERPPNYISPLSDSVRKGDDWGKEDE
jgi:hypothetical protein